MRKQIYVDDEEFEMVADMRRDDPDFSLSDVCRKAIRSEHKKRAGKKGKKEIVKKCTCSHYQATHSHLKGACTVCTCPQFEEEKKES